MKVSLLQLFSHAFLFISLPSLPRLRSVSLPTTRKSVFLLLAEVKSNGRTRQNLVGSAVAVLSKSRQILFTAGHCLFDVPEGATFICAKKVTRKDSPLRIDGESFPVVVLFSHKEDPDFGVLRRDDGILFPEEVLVPVCEESELPWSVDREGYNSFVQAFHYPCAAFMDDPEDDSLGCEATNMLTIARQTDHHFFLSQHLRGGSSGGAVVVNTVSGWKLLGILIASNPVGQLTIENLKMCQIDGKASSSSLEPLPTMKDDKKGYGWKLERKDKDSFINEETLTDIASITGSIKEMGIDRTVAIVPALLSFTKHSSKCSVLDWLCSESSPPIK